MESQTSYIYLANMLIWAFPAFILAKPFKTYYIIAAAILSASYWIYLPISDLLGLNYDLSINQSYIKDALVYSAYSGFFFGLIFLIFGKPKAVENNFNKKITQNPIYKLPGSSFNSVIKIISFVVIISSYTLAIKGLNLYDRIEWSNTSSGQNVAFLTNTLSVVIAYSILLDYKKLGSISWINLFLLILFIFLVGFDGSRRQALTAIFGIAAFFIFTLISENKFDKKSFLLLLFFALLANALAFNRSYLVGWNALFDYEFMRRNFLSSLLLLMTAPMSTIHVNTHMISYVELHGTQGYWNYLAAFLNTLFPHFIFDEYLFGIPLVTKIHEELGWVGFDFGFMAEAIYSGGLFGVIISHSVLSMVYAFLIRAALKNGLFYKIFLLCFIFAMINSIRSDLMNFLKVWFYFSVLLSSVILAAKIRMNR